MNLLIDNLRYTVSRIFDLYFIPFKKLSVYVLWISVFCLALASGLMYVLSLLFPSVLPSQFLGLTSSPQVLGLVQAILILSMSVFGVVLLRWKEEEVEPSANISAISNSLTTEERRSFGMSILIILVVHALLFDNPLALGPISGLIGMTDSIVYPFSLRGMSYGVIEILKNLLLPCFLGMVIVLRTMSGRMDFDVIREYKVAYLSSLTLLFALSTVGYTTIDFVYAVLVRFLIMMSSVFSGIYNTEELLAWSFLYPILYSLAFLVSLGLYAPAISGAFTLPFYKEEERLASMEEERDIEDGEGVEGLKGDEDGAE